MHVAPTVSLRVLGWGYFSFVRVPTVGAREEFAPPPPSHPPL